MAQNPFNLERFSLSGFFLTKPVLKFKKICQQNSVGKSKIKTYYSGIQKCQTMLSQPLLLVSVFSLCFILFLELDLILCSVLPRWQLEFKENVQYEPRTNFSIKKKIHILKQHVVIYILGFKHQRFLLQYKTKIWLSGFILTSGLQIRTSYIPHFFSKRANVLSTYYVLYYKQVNQFQ